MTEKGNSFRRNRPGNTANKGKRPQGVTGRRSSAKGREWQLGELTAKTVKIIGLFLLLLSIYFLIAFTSYLFTWQEDQSYISSANGGWDTLFKTRAEVAVEGAQPVVHNWMGKLGALLAHQFIYKWFGIASFIFVAVLFVIGYRLLFKVKIVSIWRMLAYACFGLVFLSVAIGFLHGFVSPYPHFLEGEFGYWSNRLLAAQIGVAGVGGLLVFVLLTALIVIFNLDFKYTPRTKPAEPAEPEPGEAAAANRIRDDEQYLE